MCAKTKILITNLNSDPDNDVDLFIESILKSHIKDRFELHLAIFDNSSLWSRAQQLGIKCHVINIPSHVEEVSRKWRLIRALQMIYLEEQFNIIHTNSRLDHEAACWWKFFFKPLALVIRTRYLSEKIKDNLVSRLLHNKLTSVNIILDKTTEMSLREGRPAGMLRLDNPCTLQDSIRLSRRGLEMLEHCYLSMTSATRNQIFSERVTDWSHIAFSYIIHFYFNQGDGSPLLDLLRRYEQYDPKILNKIHFVIVDDGSPIKTDVPDLNLNFTWLKINEDIPWNQGGARNLGVIYAKSDNILLSDLDIEFPEETLHAIITAPPCGKNFYKFYMRDNLTGKLCKGHSNTFLMSRARFLRFSGYDEEFSGHYGAEDFRFVKFQKAQGSRQQYFNLRYTCHRRSDIERKTKYHSLERDLSFNTPVDARKKFEMGMYGHDAGHTRTFLNFTWTKVYEKRRNVEFKRDVDRLWRYLWYWRWLVRLN